MIYQEKARQKDISLCLEHAESVLLFNGDETVFRQITENLISNAVKYSPVGKHVAVRCFRQNEHAVIEIQDQGPGFTEEDKQKLFQRFQKLSARPTGGEHSTGLGLSIVHKLVQLLNGTIECISEAGNGATFRVTFPASDIVY
jgi:signal transduction histidine kinase